MWQCFEVLRISERNLYNDLGSHACKNYTRLKLQALRQYSKVLLISEWNFHSAQSSDTVFVNDSNLVYKLCISIECISLFLFLFFLHRYNDKMPKYGLSMIRIFPYTEGIISVFSRIWTDEFVHIGENTVQKKPIFWQILLTAFLLPKFYNGLTYKHNPFRDIEKFHQPSTITPLQLGSFRR